MINQLQDLLDEHGKIEQILAELEVINEAMPINYPNLIHTCRELFSFWDIHENNEEKIFQELEKKGLKIPIEKIVFEHGELKKYKEAIINAINSSSEIKIKEAMNREGKEIIGKIRKHIAFEDELIYAIPEDTQLAF